MPIFNKNIIVKRLCLFIFVILLCTGCGGPFYYKSTFDKAQAEQMMRPGRNTIIVNCFSKDPHNGEIVTCANQPTTLVPATERATEYVQFIWGYEKGGQKKTNIAMIDGKRIQNPDPDFAKFETKQVCDPEGFVTFSNVADGEFYVFSGTPETQRAYSFMYAGKVKVQGGETKKVVLRGPSHDPDNPLYDDDYQEVLQREQARQRYWDRHSYWDEDEKRWRRDTSQRRH